MLQYLIFRPEFVTRYEKPLNSDALSPFGKETKQEDIPEIQEAYRKLMEEIIPKLFVCYWLKLILHSFTNQLSQSLEDSSISMKPKSVVRWMNTLLVDLHRHGYVIRTPFPDLISINIRYLGFVRKGVDPKSKLSQLLLLAMIYRIVKNDLRRIMRQSTKEDLKANVIAYLNLLLGFPGLQISTST